MAGLVQTRPSAGQVRGQETLLRTIYFLLPPTPSVLVFERYIPLGIKDTLVRSPASSPLYEWIAFGDHSPTPGHDDSEYYVSWSSKRLTPAGVAGTRGAAGVRQRVVGNA